ncbi:DUF4352 domain-containing protein [Ornithinicoccus hortensis]|uniref:DUF4352 domain-containing protein n=1 Tax=Ornithinicoccus hortensis TaxID=82346 RepID=A0A542YU21_9MICO|nr:DUF4352 domain-containing protein [Ornithinicoccus hortensis]TQL51590.1 hypothetical protein FB467_2740 [Ornithinicoccus hortensis]
MSTSRSRRVAPSRRVAALLAAPALLTVALSGCGSVPESESPGAPAAAPTSEAPGTDADPTTEAPAPTTDTAPTTDAAPTTDTAPTTETPAPPTGAAPTDTGSPGGGGEASGETGSLESPIPMGSTVEVGDWTVTLDAFEKDATQALSGPEFGNPDPPEGSQFSLLSVTATYHGEDRGSAFMDLWFELLGPDGVPTSDTEGEFCSAGMDTDLIAAPDAEPGDTIEGQVCFIVATEDLEDSVLLVEELLSMDRSGSYFVALQ